MEQQRINFAMRTQQIATRFTQVTEEMRALMSAYFARGYAGSFTDSDLKDAGNSVTPTNITITADDVVAFINLAQQLDKFLDNQVPAQGDYRPVLHRARNDF